MAITDIVDNKTVELAKEHKWNQMNEPDRLYLTKIVRGDMIGMIVSNTRGYTIDVYYAGKQKTTHNKFPFREKEKLKAQELLNGYIAMYSG